MTLVEVLVAIAIAGMVSAGLYASAIFTLRQTDRNVKHMYALQIVNSASAKARAARFGKLTAAPTTLDPNEFERQFTKSHTVESDPNHDRSTTYTLNYHLKGFGRGVSGSSSVATLSLPAHSSPWKQNEFAGHFLVVTGGKGANQIMYIKSHAASIVTAGGQSVSNVTLTKNFDGSGSEGWDVQPDDTSTLAVDYGLYCEISASWEGGEGFKTIRETVYVPTG